LQLAWVYEELKRDDDAAALYEKLLGSRGATINVRARAAVSMHGAAKIESRCRHSRRSSAGAAAPPGRLFLDGERCSPRQVPGGA